MLSISDIRNSLNQTSPLKGPVDAGFGFFTPIINVLTCPKFGFPLIPIFNLLFDEPKALSFKKAIPFASGIIDPAPARFKLLILDNKAKGNSISLSANQISSAVLALNELTFNGISI